MTATKRCSFEPWIESLVLSYGQQGKSKFLKGYILQVTELSGTYAQKENVVALLEISDGLAFIAAVLTKQAWEVIQEMEDRDAVSGLKMCTAFLQVYSLEFQCEAEICKSRFFLTVDKLATVAFGAMNDVPCCTTLPAVRQKICETWKSLRAESSSTSMCTQSGICLSDLLTAWFEDEMGSLLADAQTRLSSSAALPSSSSPSPRPSTSWAEAPSSARSDRLPTGWHADRARYQGLEAFAVPVSHLYIPAEQMELMQRQPERRGELEPQDGNGSTDPADRGESAVPDSPGDGSFVMAPAEQEEGPANPWDVYALENLSTSSVEVSSSRSPVPDPSPDRPSPSLLLPPDRDQAAVPMATSTQALPSERPSSRDLFTSSDQSSRDVPSAAEDHAPEPRPLEASQPKSNVQSSAGSSTPSFIREIMTGSENPTLPPYQKPRPRNGLSCCHVQDNDDDSCFLFDKPNRPPVLLHSLLDRRCGNNTTTPAQRPPPAPPNGEVEEGVNARESRRELQPAFTETVTDDDGREGAGPGRGEWKDGREGHAFKRKRRQTSSPPSWLCHTQAVAGPHEGGATGEEGGPALAADIRCVNTTHPDGAPFSYRYEPTPQVAKALSLFKVPDDLVRWSAQYLLSSDGSRKTS